MATPINPLVLSYPNFVLGSIIDPDEANQNNSDIVNKVNEFITEVEAAMVIAESADTKADSVIVTANSADGKADSAVATAGVADGKADSAVATAGLADSKADAAVSTSNTALGQDTVVPYTGALGALKVATDVKNEYDLIKPELEAAVDSVALKADVAYVDSVAADFVLGIVPDGSISDDKLSNAEGAIKDVVSEVAIALGTHLEDVDEPHQYEDVSIALDWVGVKYKIVANEGKAYLEVVSV